MKFRNSFSDLSSFAIFHFVLLLQETTCWPPAGGTDCKTPLNAYGKCIVLSSCEPLMKLLLQPPVSPNSLSFLQRSTCDFASSEPKVCCADSQPPQKPLTQKPWPISTTTIQPTTPKKVHLTTRPTATTQPTSKNGVKNVAQTIINHRNLHLLPNSSNCGETSLGRKITGGSNAGLGNYNWMVLIGYPNGGDGVQFACGGTLINSKYVLTAAHCVTKLPEGVKPIVVRVGEYNQKTDIDCENAVCAPKRQDIPVQEISYHEKYDLGGRNKNDIALIRLQYDAVLGSSVTPVCLPHGEPLQKLQESQRPIVAGWGRLISDNPDMSDILQVVSVPFVTTAKCKGFYPDYVDEGNFCAGGVKGQDSCQGDSGGPLMLAFPVKALNRRIRIYQFGITSLGPKHCGAAGLPALYTKVPYFMPWILDHLKP